MKKKIEKDAVSVGEKIASNKWTEVKKKLGCNESEDDNHDKKVSCEWYEEGKNIKSSMVPSKNVKGLHILLLWTAKSM